MKKMERKTRRTCDAPHCDSTERMKRRGWSGQFCRTHWKHLESGQGCVAANCWQKGLRREGSYGQFCDSHWQLLESLAAIGRAEGVYRGPVPGEEPRKRSGDRNFACSFSDIIYAQRPEEVVDMTSLRFGHLVRMFWSWILSQVRRK